MDKVKDVIKQIINFIKVVGEAKFQKINDEKEARLKSQLAVQMQNIAMQVRDELFECIHNFNNNKISRIVAPSSIRVDGWFNTGQSILLYYSISKSESEKLAHIILANMMANFNKDIASTANALINAWGLDYVRLYYPHIYNGIYVTSVRDMGLDIEIEVTINI